VARAVLRRKRLRPSPGEACKVQEASKGQGLTRNRDRGRGRDRNPARDYSPNRNRDRDHIRGRATVAATAAEGQDRSRKHPSRKPRAKTAAASTPAEAEGQNRSRKHRRSAGPGRVGSAELAPFPSDRMMARGMTARPHPIGAVVAGSIAAVCLLSGGRTEARNTGAVDIRSQPAGAAITVDGVAMGVAPQLVSLAPGRHTVRLTLPGYRPEVQEITVSRKGITRLYIRLVKEEAGGVAVREGTEGDPRPGMGVVVVVTTPAGLTLFLDGKASPQKTPVTVEVAPGAHTVALAHGSTVLHMVRLSVKAGEKVRLKRDLSAEVRKLAKADDRERSSDSGDNDGSREEPTVHDAEKPSKSSRDTGQSATEDRGGETKNSGRHCACPGRSRLAACVARKRVCSLHGFGDEETGPYALCRGCPAFRRLRGARLRHAESACDTRNSKADECVCRDILRVLRECLGPHETCLERCQGKRQP